MPAERIISHAIGGKSCVRHPDELIAEIAGRQHGVVGLWQLLASGLSRRMAGLRLGRGTLHRVHAGVYAVGHPALTPNGRLMAGVLAPGPGALLSHRSAAWLWGLLRTMPTVVDVTHSRRLRPRPGLRFHRADVSADETGLHRGIPVTSPFRTLLDYAAEVSVHELGRALHEAEVARLTDGLSLEKLIGRYPGRRGAARLRVAAQDLDRGVRQTRSELEDRFLLFADQRGLPAPETNVRVPTARRIYEVDCLWRAEWVIVELDGSGAHDTNRAFYRDRAKLRALTVAGWKPLPVTRPDIDDDPVGLDREIRGLLGRGPR